MDFITARDFLLAHRLNYEVAYRDFRWPDPEHFNWALDWFDTIAIGNQRPGLWIVEDDGTETILSFAELAERSNRLASWLRDHGVRRGDRTLLMLGNRAALWECILAHTKLGAVMIPSTTLLTPADIADRVARGHVAHVIAETAQTGHFAGVAGDYTRIAVGVPVEGWLPYGDFIQSSGDFTPDGPTPASDPLFLYFTSGTTAKPKLVEHTHASYPVGHLSTMYWTGIQPGDVHLNISSPGWAKHAWSNVFAPWNAAATVLILNTARFSAQRLLDTLTRCSVTSFCAPPTVWRLLIQEDLRAWQPPLREVLSAGEPLNPEVIEQVQRAWGLTIRDGYGQTETTAQVGNTPGQRLLAGSMGRPLPGYAIELIDPATGAHGDQGEICIDLSRRPLALMVGYRDDPEHTAEVMRGGFYHTGDVHLGTATATSRMSVARTTSSRRPTIGSPPSSSRVSSSSIPGLPRRRSCRRRIRSGSPSPRHTSRLRPGTKPPAILRARSSIMPTRTWPATSASAGSSSRTCPRPSPARSGGSTCAPWNRHGTSRAGRHAPRTSTGKRTFPSCSAAHRADSPRSHVEAVDPLGDAARLLATLALDDEVDDDLDAAIRDMLD